MQNYMLNRAIFALIILVASISAWALLSSGEPEVRTVSGKVIEVNRGESKNWKDGRVASLVTARVKVGDAETRIMLIGQVPEVGSEIELIEETYPDGQARYRLAGRAQGL